MSNHKIYKKGNKKLSYNSNSHKMADILIQKEKVEGWVDNNSYFVIGILENIYLIGLIVTNNTFHIP